MTVLEDALLELPNKDRPAVLELLRQSYEVLARKADAAGRPQDAAHYRDNLAILDRNRAAIRPGKPSESRPQPAIANPVLPKPNPPRKPASDRPHNARPPAMAVPSPDLGPVLDPRSNPPLLGVPAPLPEPEQPPPPIAALPRGNQPAPRAPGNEAPRILDSRPASEASPRTKSEQPERPGAGLTHVLQADDPDASIASINPADGTPDAESERATNRSPEPAAGVGLASPAASPNRPVKETELRQADRLFSEERYDDAGRLYGTLARQNHLPANRRTHWAYCRAVDVVRKINAHPRSGAEWDAIQAEVQDIQRLTPNHWIGEYLRNVVGESRVTGRQPMANSNKLVIRGSEPDEAPPPRRPVPRRFGRARGAANPQPVRGASPPPTEPVPEQALSLPMPAPVGPQPEAKNAASPTDDGVRPQALNHGASVDLRPGEEASEPRVEETPKPSLAESSDPIEWQVHQTANFRIFHCDSALAQQAATVAESVRTAQAKRWGSPAIHTNWTPLCDLYLYPNPQSYAQGTGQPEISPGISTMTNNGVRVLSRRMSLRADNPMLLTATLPHEVTHIVLSDLFVVQQIPRWADEGIAVLAEPLTEQHHRAAELREPLEAGRVFPVSQLMAMEYPEQKDWRLFYAQSVSLTHYLVDQGPPERFVQFVRDSQRIGTAAALRDIYQIEGPSDLHNRWLDYARKQLAVDTASSRNAETAPAGLARD